ELGSTPDRFEERVGLEALQVRGRARAPVHSWDIEGAHRRVAEARREERRADERLAQERVYLLRRHEPDEPLGPGRDLARGERKEDAVVDVARLRDEAEGEPELPGTGRMLPLPERDRRRPTLRVLDEHTVGADLDDPPRVRAEEEDVAREALGDELLVERADLEIGLGDEDVEEPRVGD